MKAMTNRAWNRAAIFAVCVSISIVFIAGVAANHSGKQRLFAQSDSGKPHPSSSRPSSSRRGNDSQPDRAARARIHETYGKLPMRFEAIQKSRGRTGAEAGFISRGAGYSLFLAANEAVLRLRKAERESGGAGERESGRSGEREKRAADQAVGSAVLRMRLVGANHRPRISGVERLRTTSSYFIGNDPRAWRRNVANFAKVKYESVYPGVDLVWYGNQQQLEYDFVVAPGADPNRIKFSFTGADAMTIDDEGALSLRPNGKEDGEIVRLLKPVAWQDVNGARREIACDYRLAGKSQVEFHLGEYDAKLPLVIDPVLIYSTYIGGTGFDTGLDIAVDGAGAAYITGQTDSADFPGASPIQPAKGTSSDAYVLKIDPAGAAVVFGTWIGGNGSDSGSGIAVDSSGNIYVSGSTNSSTFPLQNPLQSSRKGASDAFVAKLDQTGSALLYSTYLGGSGSDGASALAVDDAGNVYLTGGADSGDFPVAGAFQPVKKGSGAYASLNAGGDWNEIGNGLIGADVNDLVVDSNNPMTVYSATERGVFKSMDGGAQWSRLGGDQLGSAVSQLIVDPINPSNIYAVSFGSLFKSADGGATWARKNFSNIRVLAIDPATPANLYAAAINGFYRSADGGETFTPRALPPIGGGSVVRVDAVAVDPVAPMTVYAAGDIGVYKSVDGGTTFTYISLGIFTSGLRYQFSQLLISRNNPMVMYALIRFGGLLKSVNGGRDWTAINIPRAGQTGAVLPQALAIDPTDANTIYAGTAGFGIYRSVDGGSTWQQRNNGLNAVDVRAIAIGRSSPNTVYAGTDSGNEAFVAKLNATGSALVYSSYFGGGASESGSDIAIDSSGAAYVAGFTTSPNFPAANAFQAAPGGQFDAFAAKINAAGSAVVWATYLGGSNLDFANGIAVNASGNVFVAGATASNNFPTARAIQTSLKGFQDAFVARFSADGSKLDFSTYLGGAVSETAEAIAVDSAGNCYVTGVTESVDFPVVNAVQPNRGGDPSIISNPDVFVTKFNADGSALLYSTYLGGAGFEQGYGIAVDAAGSAYVTGIAYSNDFPTTPNPIRQAGPNDAFVAKLGISADLAISLADLPDPVMINNQLTYTLIVSNNGPDPAAGVTVTDTLPSGVSVVSTTPSQGSCSGSSVINCAIGNLAPSAGAVITIVVTPTAAGTITNSASATSNTPDLNGADNSATQETKVSTLPSIFGRVTAGPGAGLNGVTVALTGAQRPPVVTANNGLYQLSELPAGGNYTVTPSRQGYVFNPANRNFTNLNSDQRADFSAVACVFSISQRSQSFPATGGAGNVTITSPDPQCAWTARSNAPWIKITSAASGNGNGTVTFSVEPTVGSRSGTITIAGNTFAVFQEFNACGAVNFPATPTIRLPQDNYGRRFLVKDFNKDGRADLAVFTELSNMPRLLALPGLADGNFGAPVTVLSLQTAGAQISAIDAADLNSDGALDLVATGGDPQNGGRVWVMIGNGAGGFATPKDYNIGPPPTAVAIGDFNGDNKPDLAVGTTAKPYGAVLLNDGAGSFGVAVNLPEGNSPFPTSLIEAVDLDGDGKLDLLLITGPGIQTYKGDGAGGFTSQPLLVLPPVRAPATGDFNGDGKLDLFFIGFAQEDGNLLVYLNDGSGRFGTAVKTPIALGVDSFEVSVGADDFNGDGKTDVVLRTAGVTLLTAAGNGRFNAPITYLSNLAPFSLTTGDYNRDGRPDVFSLSGAGQLTIVTSQGSGLNATRGYNFIPSGSLPQFSATVVESSDLNGDGLADLAIAASGSSGVFLMFGNGRGEFGAPVAVGAGVAGGGARALTIRDFNRDGKPDLAVLDADARTVTVLLGNGRGEFAMGALLNIGNLAQDLAAADFNNDGKLDLVAKGQSGGLTLFAGDGQGGFAPISSGIGGVLAYFTFTAGDFNGDGDGDLALSDDYQVQPTDGYKMVILPGDGRGGFGAPIEVKTEDRVAFISAVDLNLDGREDIVFTSLNSAAVSVALSNPGGGFAAPVKYAKGGGVRSVTVKDINGDGKLDLIAVSQESGAITVLLGKGDGNFNEPVNLPVFDSPAVIATGDFDEDGGIDLAVARDRSSLIGVLPNGSSCAPAGSVTPVSAASYARYRASAESIVALFGANLAATTQSATTLPLPTTLANTSVKVRDGAGVERLSPLFFVSPGQINHLIPAGTAPGAALVTVTNGATNVATGTAMIAATSPGLFSADSSGQGLAAAVVLRVRPDNSQVFEPMVRFDPAQNRFVAIPIDLSDASEQVFLLLFGTGLRNHSALANVNAKVGGGGAEVSYAGTQGGFAGLDQLNVRLSRSLIGLGEADVVVTVDGKAANTVRINIK